MLALDRKTVRKRAAQSQKSSARILVATAGDADSVGALHFAAELARTRPASVLALGVALPFPHTVPTMIAPKSAASMDEDGRTRVLAEMQARLADVPGADGWAQRAVVGWPADVINSSAAAWKASLIVLGLGRHSRAERVFGTETAVMVIKRASVPVLAVSPTTRGLPTCACAALDFSEASLSSAVLAADLLADDGMLMVVHACAFKGVKSRDGDLVDLYRIGARAKLDDAVAELRRRTHRRVEGHMIEGDPGESLLAYASRERCDLIALGGHEQGLLERILLGSVRTRVLRGAKCSVLISPPLGTGAK
jgi:nucleotide-binding universal stress UspA family protein